MVFEHVLRLSISQIYRVLTITSSDWNSIMRCGYQSRYFTFTSRYLFTKPWLDPYIPQYQGPLSLTVDLEPIPRVAKRKRRKIDPVHDQDLLTGFNYVAPQHSESSEADQHASCTVLSTTFHSSQLELRKGASSSATISPGDSGRIRHFRQPPDLTRVASVDDKKHRSATLKQRRWNWKRSLEHGSRHKSRTGNPENEKVCTATIRRRSLVSALCRGILMNGKQATNIIIG